MTIKSTTNLNTSIKANLESDDDDGSANFNAAKKKAGGGGGGGKAADGRRNSVAGKIPTSYVSPPVCLQELAQEFEKPIKRDKKFYFLQHHLVNKEVVKVLHLLLFASSCIKSLVLEEGRNREMREKKKRK